MNEKIEEKIEEIEQRIERNRNWLPIKHLLSKVKGAEIKVKELEEVEQERERLSKLLVEARVEIVGLRVGIKEVLEWRNLDGDGISDPLREELYKLVEEK